ncbi:hypothetical protein ONZ45_g10514 [Pleurotus djamor]|nr:hypothetical protein ONZ45_g10514 [Pleurotus djamor]
MNPNDQDIRRRRVPTAPPYSHLILPPWMINETKILVEKEVENTNRGFSERTNNNCGRGTVNNVTSLRNDDDTDVFNRAAPSPGGTQLTTHLDDREPRRPLNDTDCALAPRSVTGIDTGRVRTSWFDPYSMLHIPQMPPVKPMTLVEMYWYTFRDPSLGASNSMSASSSSPNKDSRTKVEDEEDSMRSQGSE